MTSVMRSSGVVREGRSAVVEVHNRGVKVLTDKGVLLGACVLSALAGGAVSAAVVVWLLLAVAVGGLCAVVEHRREAIAAPACYLVLGCFTTASLVGAPLVVYDLTRAAALGPRWARLVAPVCCAVSALSVLSALSSLTPVTVSQWAPDAPSVASVIVSAVISVLAVCLALRTVQEERVRGSLHAVRDDLHEKILALQDLNARLLEAQDYETRAAALSERTRIARDIHDGVGHLLTRLVLQAKALQVTHRDEPAVVADLAELDSSLGEALDSMRRSVHALSDEGEDLPTSLNLLASRCGIEQVPVDCSLEEAPPPEVSRCVIAVAREALTNAARHSRADSAQVRVVAYPAFWQITVVNEGGPPRDDLPTRGGGRTGMGLRSITERVEALGGTVRITPQPRFTVFATIPKGRESREAGA